MSSSVQTERLPQVQGATRLHSAPITAAKPSCQRPIRWSVGGTRFAPLFNMSALTALACVWLALASYSGLGASLGAFVLLAGLVAQLCALYLFAIARRAKFGALIAVAAAVGLVAWLVAHSGGLASPLLVLFALVPTEALLTRRVRVIQSVFFMSALGFAGSTVFAGAGAATFVLSQAQIIILATVGILYVVSLVARLLRLDALRRTLARRSNRMIDHFHAVTHDMFVIIGRDGHVRQAFGAVGPILGCEREQLHAQGLMERLHVSDRPSFLSSLDRVHASGNRDSVEVRLRVGAPDTAQRFIWTEIDMSCLRQANGKTTGQKSAHGDVYALVRDITAVKQRAAELTLAREKAEASDAAKGRFLATMSHELRTPLNAIIGFADILDEEVFGALANNQQREYIGLIRDSGGHLLQLVNDLLDMSKLDAGHFQIVAEPFLVNTVIKRCTRLMHPQIEKAGLTLAMDLPDSLPELVADQRAIRQVMLNLLSNACKFTPSGGTITVRARADGANLVLCVADTGIGIAAKDLSNVGQPFFQANNSYDRNHHGTGLGLSVVKGLCELHSGTLSISSVEGEGTTVTLRLPFAGPKGVPAATALQADQTRANATVLAKLQTADPVVAVTHHAPARPIFGSSTPIDDTDGPVNEKEGRIAHG